MIMCSAKQYNDQMICGQCGLQWDVNGPDPPACRPVDQSRVTGEATLAKLLESFDDN